MFKNREVRMQLVKTPKNASTPQPEPSAPRITMTPIMINEMIRRNAKDAAIGVVGVYAAIKVLNTASEIAINITPKR